jgi:hypothetical protein
MVFQPQHQTIYNWEKKKKKEEKKKRNAQNSSISVIEKRTEISKPGQLQIRNIGISSIIII